MWTACTLTIRRALYDYVRQEYQLTVSYNGFPKVLKEKWKFYPIEEYLTTLGECYEDDHTAIDLREAIDHLSDSDRQIRWASLTRRSVTASRRFVAKLFYDH